MYQILEAYDKTSLVLEVDDYLQEGWKLAGGLAIHEDGNSTGSEGQTYCQAIYKDNTESLQ